MSIREMEGSTVGSGLRVAIVVSRWNEFITRALLQGALDALKRMGVAEKDITVVKVPGSFEIPLAVRAIADARSADAVVALGCVIRGATAHFDHVANAVTAGINSVMLETRLPVAFGVLTVDTIEQAIERAGSKAGNKGAEAAQVAVEMTGLLRRIAEERDVTD